MKKISIIIFLIILSTCAKSFGQDTLKVESDQVPLALLRQLDHDLTLDNQQKRLALNILIERSQQLDLIKMKDKDIKLTKASCQSSNEQALTKLLSVLTAEQREKLKLIRQNDQAQKKAAREEGLYLSVIDVEMDF